MATNNGHPPQDGKGPSGRAAVADRPVKIPVRGCRGCEVPSLR